MLLVAPRPTSATRPPTPAPPLAERWLSAWMLLVAAVSFAALAIPPLMGRVYVADDLGEFHLPLRDFYARQLAAGEPFDWMPSLYGGFYVTGEGQLGAYHPLHRWLYRWLPLDVAFDLELLISYPLMFGGTFLLLRHWLERRDAALFGALAFTFCGFNLLHFVHPNAVAIVAHVPWLLLAIEIAIASASGSHRAAAELAVALLTASQLMLGYPQYVWFSLLLVSAYTTWRVVAVGAPLARPALLIVAMLLGAATAGVQLWPTFDALAHSTRAASEAGFADTGALHPLNLVQLVAPYLFATRVVGQNTHELGVYFGAVPLLLCVWLFAQRRRWGQFAPLAWAALIMAGFALLLAFGNAGGLYRLQAWLPVVNHFRFPCRAIVLVQFAAAIVAAIAFALLRTGADTDPAARAGSDRWLASVVLASVGLAIVGPLAWPEFVAPPLPVWLGPVLIAAAAVLVAMAERGRRFAFVGLVLLTSADLCGYGFSYAIWSRTATLDGFMAKVLLPPGGPRVRVAADSTGGRRIGDRMLLAGLSRIDGYAGLEPDKRLDYTTEPARQLAGAQFVWKPTVPGSDTRGRWNEVTDPAPRVRLVTRILPLEQLLATATVSLDSAAVDEPLSLPTSQPGNVRITIDRPGHLAVECNAPTRQLLVTTESFHPGWQAVVDGRRQAAVRVNGDFLGCVVPAGAHVVDLRFLPRSLRMGEYVSAGGLGLLLCTFLVRTRTRRNSIA